MEFQQELSIFITKQRNLILESILKQMDTELYFLNLIESSLSLNLKEK